MAIFANPYLISYLKKIWLLYSGRSEKSEFSIEDYIELSKISGLGIEYLPKVLRADTAILYFRLNTLDNLCGAIHKKVPSFPNSWQDLIDTQFELLSYQECEKLHERKIAKKTRLENLDGEFKGILSRITHEVIIEVSHFFADNPPYPNRTTMKEGKNIADVHIDILNPKIKKADEKDIYKIYELANKHKSYGDCPINDPTIKIPWWRQNHNIFYVMYDQNGNVCANLNLLPLRDKCYDDLRKGIITEAEILPTDLYQEDEREHVRFIYVEGLNCLPPQLVIVFLDFFTVILNELSSYKIGEITIGAIEGTGKGGKLMKKLSFEIVRQAKDRKDNMDFFELLLANAPAKYVDRQKVLL